MKKVFFRSLACLISLLTPLSALAEPLPHWDTTCSLAVKADDLQGTIANDVPVYEEAIESNPEAEDTIEVNLYFLNTEYEDYISLPEGYAQSYQIRFSDGSVPTGYHFSGNHDNIDIDANGNVEVVMKSESTVLTGAGVSFYRTYGTEGSCIITVQNDEETLHFKINTISYGSYHAKEVVQEYLDSNISPSMTEMEKLKLICEYVCSFDYKASGMFGSLDAFVYDNGGDCWASTSTVNYMCRQVGLTAWSRNASDDPGAGENHQNSIVRFSDDTTYMVDCGYNEKAPRNYSIKQIETGVSEDNFICTAESDGTVTIKEYLGNIEELVIPQEIGGATVTGIGGSVFSGHTELTSITFPKTLRKISSNCFSGCTNLAAIDFPDSLYDIGQSVFEDTAWYQNQPDESLVYAGNVLYRYKGKSAPEKIIVRNGTTGIADSAFFSKLFADSATLEDHGCKNVTSIILPEGVVRIGNSAFHGCTALATVQIPSTMKIISQQAFEYCSSLTSLDLSTVSQIDDLAFLDCTALRTIKLPETIEEMGDGVFIGCASLESVALPEGTKRLVIYTNMGYMFSECTNLKNVSIPASVTNIDSGFEFWQCENLVSIKVSEENTKYCDKDGILFNKDLTTLIKYPAAKELKTYAVPETVTAISGCAFEYARLNSVTVGNQVTSIGNCAFSHCPNLSEFTVPANIEGLYARTFEESRIQNFYVAPGNTLYTAVDGVLYTADKKLLCMYPAGRKDTIFTIPKGTKEISEYAFAESIYLENVVFPDSVDTIQSYAFTKCSSLQYEIFPEGLQNIDPNAFEYCDQLSFIVLPSSLTGIGYESFNNTGMKEIYYNGTKEDWDEVDYLTRSGVLTGSLGGDDKDDKRVWVFDTGYVLYFNQEPLHWEFDERTKNMKKSGVLTGSCGEEATYTFDFASGEMTVSGTGTVKRPEWNYDGWMYGYWSSDELVIKKLIFEDGITEIGYDSFNEANNLSEVIIPESCVVVNSRSFDGNSDTCFTILNTDCKFGNVFATLYGNEYQFKGIIKGYQKSTAEAFAKEKSYRFAAIDKDSGDVNEDGIVSVADAVMLQKWLLCAGNLKNWYNADLYEDGIIDVFDLAMIKRLLIGS